MNKTNDIMELKDAKFEVDNYGRCKITDPDLLEKIIGGAGMMEVVPETVSNGACINASC